MATEVFANQAFTTVLSGGTSGGTVGTVETWTVSALTASEFPAASTGVSQFHVTDTAASASSEIILVTDTNAITDQWTVTRGAEGTSPVAHAAGFTITQVLTAGWLSGVSSGVATVGQGGTGGTQATAYAVITGGTASTSPFQTVSGVGTSGQVLTSQGAGSLPTWTSQTGLVNPMSALGDMISGGTAGTAVRLAGGTAATKQFLTQTGAGTISAAPQWGTIAAGDVPTLNQSTTGTAANVSGTVATGNGGTGLASLTTYALLAGGTTTAAPVQQIAAGTSGQVLTGNGVGTLPSFQAIPTLNQNTTGTAANVTGTVATINGGTGLGSVTAYAVITGGTSATTALQTVPGVGTAGQGFLSNGAGSLPSWQTTVNSVTAADTTIAVAGTGLIPALSSPRHATQAAKYGGVAGQPPRESIPFWAATTNNVITAGVVYLMVIPVEPGDVITNVGFQTGATPAFMGTNPNWWTALYTAASGSTATFVAQSGTQGSTAIGGASAHMLALQSPAPYTVPTLTSYVYGAVMINTGSGGTQPTMRGPSMNTATVDASTSMFPTSAIYSGTNGSSLAGSAPTGTITLAVNANLLYLGAD